MMKVAGFTFIRNAVKYDFPVVEAITSVLPLCDLFVVALGRSEDQTEELLRGISGDKIRIIPTEWDETLTHGGEVYACETNKAFDAIPVEFDWCFYIQGDEVLHENDLPKVKAAMERWADDREVEGLLFDYLHFYGNFDHVGDSRHWYRREVRVIRNDKSIRSYRDAQGFRREGRKIKAVPADAAIYHYGWVRHPLYMQRKVDAVSRFYSGISAEEAERKAIDQEFDYGGHYDALARFNGSHPRVMEERIKRLNWEAGVDITKKRMNLRYLMLYYFEKLTGIRPFEFRNYTLLKRK
ncbi:MAG TPA: hypothetical protein PKJ58_12560 [Prolixibacteraceae bacterium]|nr:hypothetical protein [Prolixibacteraceae bacterium]